MLFPVEEVNKKIRTLRTQYSRLQTERAVADRVPSVRGRDVQETQRRQRAHGTGWTASLSTGTEC